MAKARTILALAIVILFLGMALFAPLISPYDPFQGGSDALKPPGTAGHLVGTNHIGQDIATQVIYGARVSLAVGIAAALSASLLGTLIGSLAGFFGGWVDGLLMRFSEFFQVLPRFVLALVIVAFFGSGVFKLILVLAILSWPQTARLARAQILSLRESDLCGGGPPERDEAADHHRARDPAQCPGAHRDRRLAGYRLGHPAGSQPELLWAGRPQPGQLGVDAQLRAGLPAAGLVDGALPGAGHFAGGFILQYPGRRAQRHPEPAPEGIGMSGAVLDVRRLVTQLHHRRSGWLPVVDDVSLSIDKGEIVGLVGESGCGKSMTAFSIMQLFPTPAARVAGGEVIFKGRDLLKLPPDEMRSVRGAGIGMIFQDPSTFLDPLLTLGDQIAEPLYAHQFAGSPRARTLELIEQMGLPDPPVLARRYPHQVSGGQKQRALIATAMACAPDLLIADEPTTALDVTIQAQILDLMRSLRAQTGAAILLITHDLGVVAEMCDRVYVMYAGRVVEQNSTAALFKAPRHPYTQGLLNSTISLETASKSLFAIPGTIPGLEGMAARLPLCPALPAGCPGLPGADAGTGTPGKRHGGLFLHGADRPGEHLGAGGAMIEAAGLVKDFQVSLGLFRGKAMLRAVDHISLDHCRGRNGGAGGRIGFGQIDPGAHDPGIDPADRRIAAL